MKNGKPLRARILFWTSIFSCALMLLIILASGLSFVVTRGRNPAVLRSLFFVPFFFYGLLMIYIIKKIYPAGEISRGLKTLFSIHVVFVIIVLLLDILIIVAFIVSTHEQGISFSKAFQDPDTLVIITALACLLLSQLYMLIEGIRLMKTIRKNFRNTLIDSL